MLNSVLNKYERWSENPTSCQKRLILYTAPVSILLAVSSTFLWECMKLPFACASIPFYFASRFIRLITKSQANTRLEQAFHSPVDLLSCLGKIIQLVEGLLYSLVAFFNLRATLNFFKGAGLFNSRRDCQRVQQQMKTQQQCLIREGLLNNRINTLNAQLANRPTNEVFSNLEHQLKDQIVTLNTQLEELSKRVHHLTQELELATVTANQVPALQDTITRLQLELQDEKNWEAELKTLQEQIDRFQEELKQEDLNNCINQMVRFDSSRRLLNEKLEEVSKELVASQCEYAQAKEMIQKLHAYIGELTQQNEEFYRQLQLVKIHSRKSDSQVSSPKRMSKRLSALFSKTEN